MPLIPRWIHKLELLISNLWHILGFKPNLVQLHLEVRLRLEPSVAVLEVRLSLNSSLDSQRFSPFWDSRYFGGDCFGNSF